MKEKINFYCALLEKYSGTVLSGINRCDLCLIKKGMGLPVTKQLYYRHKCSKIVQEIIIEDIYKPSYMCRLLVTTDDGQQYRVLSEYFVEMQKKK